MAGCASYATTSGACTAAPTTRCLQTRRSTSCSPCRRARSTCARGTRSTRGPNGGTPWPTCRTTYGP
nr:MAG TPA: hypothetical protein [Caudoviricetes sp.]